MSTVFSQTYGHRILLLWALHLSCNALGDSDYHAAESHNARTRTEVDAEYYYSILAKRSALKSSEYMLDDSSLNNGVLQRTTRQKNLECKVAGLMRTESVVTTPDGDTGMPLITLYDHEGQILYYRMGDKVVRAPLNEVEKMAESLHGNRDVQSGERYEIFHMGSAQSNGVDMEVFSRYSWTKDPGIWSSVWVDTKSGIILKTVEFGPYGMLRIREVQNLKHDHTIPEAAFRQGFDGDEDLPVMGFLEFLTTE